MTPVATPTAERIRPVRERVTARFPRRLSAGITDVGTAKAERAARWPRSRQTPEMDADFSTEITNVGGETVVHVRGEIDMATCARLRDAIEPFMAPEQSIVLDLAEVRFMDSSMLHLLVQARGRLTEDGGSLVLRNPSGMARRLLSISGLQDLLDDDAAAHSSDAN